MFRALFLLSGLFVLTAHAQEEDDIYAFHAQFAGVYWDPGDPGTGYGVDVQNGVLFGTVYSYRDGGQDAFLTLISREADPVQNFVFSGDVFQTRDFGAETTDVGDFTLELLNFAGQTGIRLTIDSPLLNFQERDLIRFGYGDGDVYGPLAGKLWGISLTRLDEDPLSSLDFINGLFFIDGERVEFSDGSRGLLVEARGDLQGIAQYFDDSREYVVFLDVPPRDSLFFVITVTSHTDMFGVVELYQNEDFGEVVQERSFVGSAVTSLRGGGLGKRAVEAAELESLHQRLKAFRAHRSRTGRAPFPELRRLPRR